jgi:hypothetical protein
MNKLEWQQETEDFYNCLLNKNNIGSMIRHNDNLWYLSLPDENIYNFGQYRNDLIEFAEIQINRPLNQRENYNIKRIYY